MSEENKRNGRNYREIKFTEHRRTEENDRREVERMSAGLVQDESTCFGEKVIRSVEKCSIAS